MESILPGLLGTSFLVSLLHAAIPSHWLAFVLVGRAGRWSRLKVLTVTAAAGGGHVVMTAILGAVIAFTGMNLFEKFGIVAQVVAGSILIFLGAAYMITGHIRHGKTHDHAPKVPGKATVISLLLVLSFSPCEAMLPIYLVVSKFGWPVFFLVTAVLALGTLLGMFIFVAAAMSGMERLKLSFLDEHESLIMGGMMAALGVVLLFLG